MNKELKQAIRRAIEAKDCRLLPSLTIANFQEFLAALEALPPCACGGRKVLAEAKGWAEEWKRGGFFEEEPDDPGTRVLILFDQQIIPEEARVPVRVIILDEPQGE